MSGVARTPNLLTESLGFDSFEPVTLVVAQVMWSWGYRWVGRYLENLTTKEVDVLQGVGFGILLFTEAITGPLSAAVGVSSGAEAVALAKALGAPSTMHLWIDDEATQGSLQDVTSYLDEKSAEMVDGAFGSGMYIGAGSILTSAQLYDLPDVTRYGRGGSMHIAEPKCSFCLWQIPPLGRALSVQGAVGFEVDVDILGADEEGRSPILWWPS